MRMTEIMCIELVMSIVHDSQGQYELAAFFFFFFFFIFFLCLFWVFIKGVGLAGGGVVVEVSRCALPIFFFFFFFFFFNLSPLCCWSMNKELWAHPRGGAVL